MGLIDRLFRDRIKSGSLSLIDHRGNRSTFGSNGNPVVVKLNRRGTLFRILRNPHLHLGECYMNGEIDILEGFFNRLLTITSHQYERLC